MMVGARLNEEENKLSNLCLSSLYLSMTYSHIHARAHTPWEPKTEKSGNTVTLNLMNYSKTTTTQNTLCNSSSIAYLLL